MFFQDRRNVFGGDRILFSLFIFLNKSTQTRQYTVNLSYFVFVFLKTDSVILTRECMHIYGIDYILRIRLWFHFNHFVCPFLQFKSFFLLEKEVKLNVKKAKMKKVDLRVKDKNKT